MELKEKIEYEYFERNFPDKMALIDSVLVYIQELIDEDLPQNRKLLSIVDCSKVMGFLEHTVGKCYSDIKNLKAYFKKMFIEYLREEELLVSTATSWAK